MDDFRDKRQAVAIGPRIVASGGFDMLYREGMSLIEEVAAYLDGDGRDESRGLSREASFVYATESMRLTTRLMQLASLAAAAARGQRGRTHRRERPHRKGEGPLFRHPDPIAVAPATTELPERLLDFIGKGDRLFDRVQQFDKLERGGVPEYSTAARRRHRRPVGAAQGRIRQAADSGQPHAPLSQGESSHDVITATESPARWPGFCNSSRSRLHWL